MSRLFIIGNGFDVKHKIPSKYADFRKYLEKTYPNVKNGIYYGAPEPSIDNHGDEFIEKEDAANFLFNVFDNDCTPDWANFEESLFNMDWGYNTWSESTTNTFKIAPVNEGIANNILMACRYIEKFFSDWVEGLEGEVHKTKPIESFEKLIDTSNEYFFSFNYTTTLENLYNIKDQNICHIHGKVGETLIFGHGHDEDIGDKYVDKNPGSEYALPLIDELLRKDVKGSINRHRKFFNTIKRMNITEIYSYGFSYGKVDLPYIKRLVNLLPNLRKWYFTKHEKSENKCGQYIDNIKKQGYKGKFDYF